MTDKKKWSLRLLAVALVALAGAGVFVAEPAAAATDACTDTCWLGYAYCASDCPEWGPNKAYCFRFCRAEYNECLASC
jgi:hypothetical protein